MINHLVSFRLGNHASPKENQQLTVARFDKEGNEIVRNDLDTLFSQSRIPIVTTSNLSRSSPTHTSPCDSASCSGSSTPQRTSSPYPTGQLSLNIPSTTMFRNAPLFTPPRALSPQAPTFQMSPSAPITVPVTYEQNHFLQNNTESISCEGSPSDGNGLQPDRSDTPHSVHSTTSNESSDSGYCGYVESFPCKIFFLHALIILIPCFVLLIMIDYYKLNRLYKALAIQKLSHPMGKATHNSPVTHHQRRLPTPHHHQAQHQHYQQHQQANHHYHNNTTATNNNTNAIPSSNLLSSSPPTPTPMNIDQFPPFYAQQSSFLPMPTTVPDSRKSKY